MIRRHERSVVLHDTGLFFAPAMASATASALSVYILHVVRKCMPGLLLTYGILLAASCLELSIHCIWVLANVFLLSVYRCNCVNLRTGCPVARLLRINFGLN